MDIRTRAQEQIDEYVDRMKAMARSESTIKRHTWVLNDILNQAGVLDFHDLSGAEVTKTVLYWRSRSRITTVATNIAIMNKFLNHVFEQTPSKPVFLKWYKPTVDWWNDTRSDKGEPLKLSEIESLAAEMPNQAYRDFVLLLFDSGARITELRTADFDKLEINGKLARVKVPRKTGWGYLWFFSDEYEPCRFDRSSILAQLAGKNTFFLDKIGYVTLLRQLRAAARRLGIKKPVNPHWFRHSRAMYFSIHRWNGDQKRFFFGWSKKSSMPAKYDHMEDATFKASLGLL